jgi:DNA polymerase-3 subunit delta'
MNWPRVIGQRRVKELLRGAMQSDRLPHAYLFYGGEGVGKDAMAIELARVLHCERGSEETCDVCSSCVKMASLQHPDVHLVISLPVGKGEQSDDDPMAKLSENDTVLVQEQLKEKALNPYHRISLPRANIIKINSIRDIRRESSMSTFDGRKRIFIISQADMMGQEAANTLLKTLEEPSGDCMFILTSAHRDALPPTILSRCQNVRFDPLTEQELRAALTERSGVEPEKAALVARLANGSYTKALDLLNGEAFEERDHVLAFVRHVLGTSALNVLQDVDRIVDLKDRERVERFLVLLLMWFRDALSLTHGGAIINVDQAEDLNRFTAKFPAADHLQSMADIEKAISLVDRNVYIKLVLLQLAMQLKRNILNQQ